MFDFSRILGLCLITIFGCAKTVEEHQEDPQSTGNMITMEVLSDALHQFQLDLFKETISDQSSSENITLSPFSVSSALFMTLNGANGTTKSAMESTLALLDVNLESLGKSFEELGAQLAPKDNHVQLELANAIFWDENRMTPKDSFLQLVSQYYSAGEFPLDFKEPEALETINGWVSENTNQKIEKIIEEITPEEVMFLINALYFKADWANPFPLESTTQNGFTLSDGSTKETDFMFKDAVYNYYRGSDMEAVQLAFADTQYQMTFLLPPPNLSIDAFIQSLSTQRLDQLFLQDIQKGRIFLYLPSFEIEYKILLNEVLKRMGMTVAFSRGEADFSKLGNAPEGNLFISRVNHKTYLKIDEKGAEGAAVTSVGVGVTSLPPTIRFDRPFVFMIRHIPTASVIFIGKLENPGILN